MAYQPHDLSVLAYAHGFTLWHYATADAVATVVAGGYFNPAADLMRAGDILIVTTCGPPGPGAGIFLVITTAGGGIDIAAVAASPA